MSQVIQTLEQQFYLAKLLGFDYDIQYKVGSSNIVVDSLSRIDHTGQAQCLLLSVPHHEFLTQLKQALFASPDFQTQKKAIQAHPKDHPHFTIANKLIFFKNAIWIDSRNPFIPALLHEYHATPLGGHFGVKKTLHHLRSNFQWTTMIADVKSSIRECRVCQQVKHVTPLGSFNQSHPPLVSGKTSRWISSPISQALTASQSFWWSSIGSRKASILVLCQLSSRLLK